MARIEPAPRGFAIVKLSHEWVVISEKRDARGRLINVGTLMKADGSGVITRRTRKEALVELRIALLENQLAAARAGVAAVG